jgi:hypothetical protein
MTTKAYSLVKPAVYMKKVRGEQAGGLGAHELAPRTPRAAATSGRGAEAGAAQDAADGGGADAVAKAPQLALDAGRAPGRVLPGQAQDQAGELLADRRPTGACAFLLPLPAQQTSVPGQEGAGGDQAVSAQPAWQVPSQACEHGAFRPRETRPDAELAMQHRDLMA